MEEKPVDVQVDVVEGDQTKVSHETHFHGQVAGSIHTGSGYIQTGTDQLPPAQTFSPDPSTRSNRSRLIAISTVVAVFLGVVSNIVAAYLQERLNLINDQGHFAVVVIVFIVTLAIGIWLAVRQSR